MADGRLTSEGAGVDTAEFPAGQPATVAPSEQSPAMPGLPSLALVGAVLRHHGLFLAVIALYLVAYYAEISYFSLSGTGRLSPFSYVVTSAKLSLILVLLFVGFLILYRLARDRPERPIGYCWQLLRMEIFTWERLFMVLPVFLAMPVFYSAFTTIKAAIPFVQPFAWDPVFAEWDRLVHGGIHPWEWLQPALGHPAITRIIHGIYITWVFVVHAVLFWQTFSLANPPLRMQFLLTYLLSWILIGSLGGTILSSAGPVYYGRVTGLLDPYAPLLAYFEALNEAKPFVLIEIQDLLWGGYENGVVAQFGGISAMPSMHIAMVTLMAIVGWRSHYVLGVLLTAFALVIWIGSIHLAWHYAIDGYVSVVAVFLLWRVMGHVVERLPAHNAWRRAAASSEANA